MIKINNKKYIKDLFRKKLMDVYPGIEDFESLDIFSIKKKIKKNSFHVVNCYVLEKKKVIKRNYDTLGRIPKGGIGIIGGSHSDGAKKEVFEILQHIFPFFVPYCDHLVTARPLFYNDKQKAYFYELIDGPNLLSWMEYHLPFKKIIPMVAEWLSRLHQIPPAPHVKTYQFNQETFDPTLLLEKKSPLVREYKNKIENYLELLLKNKPKFLEEEVFCHGDAHPENVIIIGEAKKVAFIDFSSACLSSPALDLGSFMVQLQFMASLYFSKRKAASLSKQFLKAYLKYNKRKMSKSLQKEINFVQAWVALRSMLYYLIVPDEKRAKEFEEIFLSFNLD